MLLRRICLHLLYVIQIHFCFSLVSHEIWSFMLSPFSLIHASFTSELTHVKYVFSCNLFIFMQKWIKWLNLGLCKNNLIKLFEEHLFHFRISNDLGMHCFLRIESRQHGKCYIKSTANGSGRADTASRSLDNWTHDN